MNIQYFKNYSPALGRDMECKLYGHGGQPILFIPCQDGRFFDFENFHMTDVWAPWINSGEVTIFTVDTICLLYTSLHRHRRLILLRSLSGIHRCRPHNLKLLQR